MSKSRLAGFIIDCQGGPLGAAAAFWSGALGLPVTVPDEAGDGRYAVLAPAAAGLHLEVQVVEHPPRLHLDIEATDIEAEVARLLALGAVEAFRPAHGRWVVLEAPTGHRFCVIAWREREPAQPPVRSEPARHRSALVAFVLDCRVDELASAVDFWSAALRRPVASRDQDGDGRYAELATAPDEPFLLLQRVDHDPRVHLDIETDDLDAEVARLEALGASRVRFVKRWWVLQAPTGHRFCVVRQQPAKAGLALNAW